MADVPFLCLIGMHHWVIRSSPEQGAFHECSRCGKMRDDDMGPPALGPIR